MEGEGERAACNLCLKWHRTLCVSCVLVTLRQLGVLVEYSNVAWGVNRGMEWYHGEKPKIF